MPTKKVAKKVAKKSTRTVARKATTRTSAVRTRATIRPRATTHTVKVARFGSNPQSVTVSSGASVQDVLDKAGVVLGSNDKVYINSQRVPLTSVVLNNDILSVISPKAAGLTLVVHENSR